MGKKDFKPGINGLLGESVEKADIGEPAKRVKEKYVITTILASPKTMQKIKGIAYWDRVNMKDVMNAAFNDYISKYESTRGEIKLPPEV